MSSQFDDKTCYVQKITTVKNRFKQVFKGLKKKNHYITMQPMNKNIKIYNENYKITKENELRFDVPGILLQLVPLFWLIFKLLYCTNIA